MDCCIKAPNHPYMVSNPGNKSSGFIPAASRFGGSGHQLRPSSSHVTIHPSSSSSSHWPVGTFCSCCKAFRRKPSRKAFLRRDHVSLCEEVESWRVKGAERRISGRFRSKTPHCIDRSWPRGELAHRGFAGLHTPCSNGFEEVLYCCRTSPGCHPLPPFVPPSFQASRYPKKIDM